MYFEDGSIITEGMLPGYRLVVNRDYDAIDPREDGNFDPEVYRAFVHGEVYTVSAEREESYRNVQNPSDVITMWVDTDDAIGGCYLVEPGEWGPTGWTPIDVARFYGFDGVAPKEDDE
jgi:hypothetical protein